MLLGRRWSAVLIAGLTLALVGCSPGEAPSRERVVAGALGTAEESPGDLTLVLRPADERGYVGRDWMEAWFTFSFGPYRDPRHMGFGPLRVINDDIVYGGRGFSAHGHDNLEIFTWVLDGALERWDDRHRTPPDGGTIVVEHNDSGRWGQRGPPNGAMPG